MRKSYTMNMSKLIQQNNGYAAITATIFTLVISLTIISAFTFFTLQEVKTNRAYVKSIDAHYVAESGIEDATYRVVAQKQIGASEILGVGDATTTITVTTTGNTRTIRSEGIKDAFQNNLQTTVDITSSGANFYYGVQVGDGGITMSNTSRINGNVFSNGSITGNNSPVITGDATVAGGIHTDPEVQWLANDTNQTFASTSASRDIAQSFTATATGAIPKVSVLIGKNGSPSSDITLHITTDNGGKPNRTDIANTTIKNSSVGTTASWIDVPFASPASVTSGTTYWIVLDYGSNSSTNYWNWRKDSTDAGNTGRYANDWSSSSATWINANGDLAFKVWIGGTNTQISGVTIGDATSGTGHANLFVNDTIHGSACPNAYCIIENPARQELPISDGVIQDWKDAATAGGTCAPPVCDASGNLTIAGSSIVTLGPQKITGDLIVQNSGQLIVSGTLWVAGTISFSNTCNVHLASDYGALSGVIVTSDTIDVKNSCTFAGSGQAGSYIMLLSDKNALTSDVIQVNNSSSGIIYYANKGRIRFQNTAAAKEATAYGVDLDNSATLTYESGLANVNFSSGPSGGYAVKQWHEVQ